MFDVGMIIFSLLALGLARAGKPARTERTLIMACSFGSAVMNYAAAVARWLDVRRQLGLNGRHPLFCTLHGKPLREQYVRALLGRLAEKVDVTKRVHPHAFRHTLAVELEMAGTPVTVISKLLRHSSAAVTNRYLDHMTNSQAGAVLDSVDLPPIEY